MGQLNCIPQLTTKCDPIFELFPKNSQDKNIKVFDYAASAKETFDLIFGSVRKFHGGVFWDNKMTTHIKIANGYFILNIISMVLLTCITHDCWLENLLKDRDVIIIPPLV